MKDIRAVVERRASDENPFEAVEEPRATGYGYGSDGHRVFVDVAGASVGMKRVGGDI